MNILEVENLSKEFGGIKAVNHLNLGVQQGNITAIIGPNGAGKSTVFNILTGFLKPDEGAIYFNQRAITADSPDVIARLGMGRTFQSIRLFPQLTVLENVLLAMKSPQGGGLWAALWQPQAMQREERQNRLQALALLETVGLLEKQAHLADNLSHGQRRLLEIARALALEPHMLMLDEPMAGLSPSRVVQMKQLIQNLRSQGKTILFIEHDMQVVMDISDRVIVLEQGKKIADGLPSDIQKNPAVIQAYLGRSGRDTTPQTRASQTCLLEVRDLTVHYGKSKTLEKVSFYVNEGEIVAMIGPNGAGKSTSLKAVSGLLEVLGGRITHGTITFAGESIRGLRTDQLAQRRMALVPERRRVFPTMTVWENLELGAYSRRQRHLIQSDIEQMLDLFSPLKAKLHHLAQGLSGGEQQMLAISRALMLKPKLLLADEPSVGLSPNYVDLIFEKFVEINQLGISILLVEQNACRALESCHRGYVFEVGKIALQGNRAQLLNNDKVRQVYLGR